MSLDANSDWLRIYANKFLLYEYGQILKPPNKVLGGFKCIFLWGGEATTYEVETGSS